MRSAVSRTLLALPLVFAFTAGLARGEEHRFGQALYSLEARYLDGAQAALEISLKSSGRIHLSGEGYPPIVVEIAASGDGSAAPVRFSVPGLGEGEAAVFRLELKGGAEIPKRLAGRIRAVACGEGLCRLVDEAFEIEVKR